jgi:hypothetical protein
MRRRRKGVRDSENALAQDGSFNVKEHHNARSLGGSANEQGIEGCALLLRTSAV